MDIVLQGPVNGYTWEIVNDYLGLEFVDGIVISTWEGQEIPSLPDRVVVALSEDVENPGTGNVNRQMVSSLNGMKRVESEFSVKLRSDQRISLGSFRMMKSFYDEWKESEFSGAKNRICVASNFRRFPFHPCDHLYWGNTQDLIDVFSAPHNPTQPTSNPDYSVCIRPETYIASNYCARLDDRVKTFVESPQEYLSDGAPKRKEAMAVSDEITEKIFKPFPRLHFLWPKHYHGDYFNVTNGYGEYFHEN